MADCYIDVQSTSATSATTSPLLLNETDLLRLQFLPILADNQKEPCKSVSGKILFEKKPKNAPCFPSAVSHKSLKVSRGSVKVGDWMEISLSASETYELYIGLKSLYDLYGCMDGIPYGTATYARLDSGFKQFLDFVQNDPAAARMLVASENQELLKQLLRLITQSESRESLQQSLESLENSSLDCLSDTLNIEKLKRVAQLMESNMDNCSEEFWQSTVFKENQWVLAQIFSTPCTIYKDKAYVGGKSMSNRDGNVCDFIYQNELSQNIALIEIKTPCTPIIGNSYRATYSFSSEMSGAINQVLNYKDSLTKEFYSLQSKSSPRFEVFNPKCVVIIGRISAMEVDEVAAFERFRNSLNNVTVVTFDELYTRITGLITMLSNKQSE